MFSDLVTKFAQTLYAWLWPPTGTDPEHTLPNAILDLRKVLTNEIVESFSNYQDSLDHIAKPEVRAAVQRGLRASLCVCRAALDLAPLNPLAPDPLCRDARDLFAAYNIALRPDLALAERHDPTVPALLSSAKDFHAAAEAFFDAVLLDPAAFADALHLDPAANVVPRALWHAYGSFRHHRAVSNNFTRDAQLAGERFVLSVLYRAYPAFIKQLGPDPTTRQRDFLRRYHARIASHEASLTVGANTSVVQALREVSGFPGLVLVDEHKGEHYVAQFKPICKSYELAVFRPYHTHRARRDLLYAYGTEVPPPFALAFKEAGEACLRALLDSPPSLHGFQDAHHADPGRPCMPFDPTYKTGDFPSMVRNSLAKAVDSMEIAMSPGVFKIYSDRLDTAPLAQKIADGVCTWDDLRAFAKSILAAVLAVHTLDADLHVALRAHLNATEGIPDSDHPRLASAAHAMIVLVQAISEDMLYHVFHAEAKVDRDLGEEARIARHTQVCYLFLNKEGTPAPAKFSIQRTHAAFKYIAARMHQEDPASFALCQAAANAADRQQSLVRAPHLILRIATRSPR